MECSVIGLSAEAKLTSKAKLATDSDETECTLTRFTVDRTGQAETELPDEIDGNITGLDAVTKLVADDTGLTVIGLDVVEMECIVKGQTADETEHTANVLGADETEGSYC